MAFEVTGPIGWKVLFAGSGWHGISKEHGSE